MEAVGVVFVLIALGLLVLQIVMIAKFFQIASDVNAIKSWLMENPRSVNASASQSMNANIPHGMNANTNEQAPSETIAKNNNGYSYVQEGETIIFSDGLTGKLQKRFGEWWIYTDKGNQSFADKEIAIQRLHKDLSEQQ